MDLGDFSNGGAALVSAGSTLQVREDCLGISEVSVAKHTPLFILTSGGGGGVGGGVGALPLTSPSFFLSVSD